MPSSSTDNKRYRHRRNRNNDQPLSVPIEKVKTHVKHLRAAGMTIKDIAHQAGMHPNSITRAFREHTHMHPRTAHAILTITTPTPTRQGLVDGTAARRRLQALMWMGHDQHTLSEATGLSRSCISEIVNARHRPTRKKPRGTRIRPHINQAIEDAYNQLSTVFGTSHTSRRIALKNNYAPPLAWDDDTITDPNAKPQGTLTTPAPLNAPKPTRQHNTTPHHNRNAA